MPTAVDIQVADAVVAALNLAPLGTFCQAFMLERIYIGTPDLKDISGVRVSVAPSELDDSFAGRQQTVSEVKINIGVRKKVVALPANLWVYMAELDGLRLLTRQIAIWMERPQNRVLPGLSAVLARGAENKPIFVPEHLENLDQYTSIVTLTYNADGTNT